MKKRYKIYILLLTVFIIVSIICIKKINKVDLNKNLLLYYNFDDLKESSIIDKSGNEKNGIKVGTAVIDSLGKIKESLLLMVKVV